MTNTTLSAALATLAWIMASTASATAGVVVHGFDGVSAPGAFHQVPPGFANGPHLDYPFVSLDGGVILTDDLFDNTATSGNNIYATCDTCGLGDFPPTMLPGHVQGRFKANVEAVEIDVINGFGGSSGTFTLTARDAGGAVVDTDSVVAGPFGSPTEVQHLAVSGAGIRSFRVTTSLGTGYTFGTDTLTFTVSEGTWTDLGAALGGTHGDPLLDAVGTLLATDPVDVALSNARENAPAFLFVGFSALNFSPFYGGTLVPDPGPPGLLIVLVTDGAGEIDLGAPWPAGVPTGFELYLQYWIDDPLAPFGFAGSNAVRGVTP